MCLFLLFYGSIETYGRTIQKNINIQSVRSTHTYDSSETWVIIKTYVLWASSWRRSASQNTRPCKFSEDVYAQKLSCLKKYIQSRWPHAKESITEGHTIIYEYYMWDMTSSNAYRTIPLNIIRNTNVYYRNEKRDCYNIYVQSDNISSPLI